MLEFTGNKTCTDRLLGATLPPQSPAAGKPVPTYPGSGVSNPAVRREIDPRFPSVIELGMTIDEDAVRQLVQNVRQAIAGDTRSGPVHIAYPQKDPRIFPSNRCRSDVYELAHDMKRRLEGLAPEIEWRLDNAIVDQTDLKRSSLEKRFSMLGFLDRQHYDLNGHSRLLSALNEAVTSRYILVDDVFEHGTTLANLANFIEHNNSVVLGICVKRQMFMDTKLKPEFAQKECDRLGQSFSDALQTGPRSALAALKQNSKAFLDEHTMSCSFRDPARNTACLPALATAFTQMAKKEGLKSLTHDGALQQFEHLMQQDGHSLFALTGGECLGIMQNLRKTGSYSNLMQQLQARYTAAPL